MKIALSITLTTACIVLLAGCVKKGPNNSDNENPAKTEFTKLVVPISFDWKMSQNVACNFTATNQTALVYLYLPNTTTPFASINVGAGVDPITVSIPKTVSSLVVRYEKTDGLSDAKTLTINNKTVQYTVPGDSQNAPQSTANFSKAKTDDKYKGIYYPASGMGTLMFEDLWPSYGDFDFNDFVANYRIKIEPQNQNKANAVDITLRVAAVGGSLPYDLYLQLDNVTGGQVEEVLIRNDANSNGINLANVTHLNPGDPTKTPALFVLKNIKENKNRPAGTYSYLNTAKGYELEKSQMVEIDLCIIFRNSIALSDLELDHFNFFIGTPETVEAIATNTSLKEVHMGGNNPSSLGQAVYEEITSSNPLANSKNGPYFSTDHLVWALNIPTEIPHVYERISFLKAYPNFAKWAESAGATHQDWYEESEGNRVNEHLNIGK